MYEKKELTREIIWSTVYVALAVLVLAACALGLQKLSGTVQKFHSIFLLLLFVSLWPFAVLLAASGAVFMIDLFAPPVRVYT